MSFQIQPSTWLLSPGPVNFASESHHEHPSAFQLIPCSPSSSNVSNDEDQTSSELSFYSSPSTLGNQPEDTALSSVHLPPVEVALSKTDDQVDSADLEHNSYTPYHRIPRHASDIYSDSGDPRRTRSVHYRNVLTKARPTKPEKRSGFSYTLSRLVREHRGVNVAQLSRSEAPMKAIRHLPGACPDLNVECHDNDHGHVFDMPSALQIRPNAEEGLITIGRINAPTTPASVPYLKSAPSSPPTLSDDALSCDNHNHYKKTLGLSSRTRRSPNRISDSPRKLIKRRFAIQKLEQADSLFPISALSSLSPVPLSSVAIANAKLSLQPAPPTSLSEYLAGIQDGHQLSIGETASSETMAETLPAGSPKSFKFPSPYQKWKARINFFSSISTPFISEPDHNCASASTDALASLAWTSVVPSSPHSAVEQPCSEPIKYMAPKKPSFNELKPRKGTELKRGWTFEMAMADDEVTDEVLVEELEKLRRGHGKDRRFHPSLAWDRHSRHSDTGRTGHSRHGLDVAQTADVTDPEDAATWRTERSALLCCREMVRTERRYQEDLKALLDGETTTPPPALMLTYLPALLHASQVLLQGLSEDPSAWGVSSAFMACEDEIETAMVAWCGVAGQFFSKKGKSRSWKKYSYPGPLPKPPRARTNSFSAGDGAGDGITRFPSRISDKSKQDNAEVQRRKVRAEKSMEVIENVNNKSRRSQRKLSVRDLAIQPTQRVMRYAMLYGDLLSHTPKTSPSRALVERALQAAQRIAHRCDNAQSNAAFLPRQQSTASVDSLSPFRSFMSSSRTHQES